MISESKIYIVNSHFTALQNTNSKGDFSVLNVNFKDFWYIKINPTDIYGLIFPTHNANFKPLKVNKDSLVLYITRYK